ncbi:hypothetical protein BKA81DRAFT_78817 [Phyllosticta paracitricarpa]
MGWHRRPALQEKCQLLRLSCPVLSCPVLSCPRHGTSSVHQMDEPKEPRRDQCIVSLVAMLLLVGPSHRLRACAGPWRRHSSVSIAREETRHLLLLATLH